MYIIEPIEEGKYIIKQTRIVTDMGGNEVTVIDDGLTVTTTLDELEAEKKMHQAAISAEESAIAEIDRKLEIIGNLEQ